jgi:hypothetical protein
MKKVLFLGILILCVLFNGCFDFQQENSIVGKWIGVKDVYSTYVKTYNPEIDQSYKAHIYEFTDSLMIFYRKYELLHRNDLEYCTDTLYSYTAYEDSLDLMVYNLPYPRSCGYYFTDEGQLVLFQGSDSIIFRETYFNKYKGEVPPQSWVTTITSDEYEQDGDIEHATTLRVNSAQPHTITENDSDYYHINAKAGKSYLIRGLAYFDIVMYLYDQNENLISYDKNNDLQIMDLGRETATAILWTCDADGAYYPMITADPEFDIKGYYQMLIEEVDTSEIEYEDDIEVTAKHPNNEVNYIGY